MKLSCSILGSKVFNVVNKNDTIDLYYRSCNRPFFGTAKESRVSSTKLFSLDLVPMKAGDAATGMYVGEEIKRGKSKSAKDPKDPRKAREHANTKSCIFLFFSNLQFQCVTTTRPSSN